MNAWRTLLKLKNTKKLKNKVSKNKHTTVKDKNNQIHLQIQIHNECLNNINKIGKYKKLNMTEHKTDMNITKTDKYKKLNKNSTAEYKIKMNITEKRSSTFTKEH